MNKRALLLLIIILSLSSFTYAQVGHIVGSISEAKSGGFNDNTHSFENTIGSIISLMTSKDTINFIVTTPNFHFNNVPVGKVKLMVSHISFKPYEKEINIEKDKTSSIHINLEPKVDDMGNIIVKGRAPLIVVRGDTIQFNASAIALMEGDEALKILEKMPGVVITDNGISVFGQNVAKTYVDGVLLFGNNSMTALQNLPASDVLTIDSYEEKFSSNPKRKKKDSKVRVLNIKTKSKLVSATNAKLLASGGPSNGSSGDDIRYRAGASMNFFSEKFTLETNFLSNNISSRFSLLNDLFASMQPVSGVESMSLIHPRVTKIWGDANDSYNNTNLSASYRYTETAKENVSRREQLFFPTEQYENRSIITMADTYNKTKAHRAQFSISHAKTQFGIIRLAHDMSFGDGVMNSNNNMKSIVDNSSTNIISERDKSSNTFSIKEKLYYDFYLKSFRLIATAEFDKIKSDGTDRDKDYDTSVAEILQDAKFSRESEKTSFTAGIGTTIYFTEEEKDNMRVNFGVESEDNSGKRMLLDARGSSSDRYEMNIYDYKNSFKTYRGGISFAIDRKWSYIPGLIVDAVDVNRKELLPVAGSFDKPFLVYMPSFAMRRTHKNKNYEIVYDTKYSLPSINQWQAKVDNSNPLFITIGNPNLKHSFENKLLLHFNMFSNAGNTFTVRVEGGVTSNNIVRKVRFFEETTVLPQYDNFVVEKNSSVVTYENLNNSVNVSMDVNHDRYLKIIKSKLELRYDSKYSYDPLYFNGKLLYNNNYTNSFTVRLNSNLSKKVSFDINESIRFISSRNSDSEVNNTINNNIVVKSKVDKIYKNIYVETSYSFDYYKSEPNRFAATSNHLLNASIGSRFMKGNLSVYITANDILNRNKNFMLSTYGDYILSSYNNTLGRFFLLNIQYKFYKAKGGSNLRPIQNFSM